MVPPDVSVHKNRVGFARAADRSGMRTGPWDRSRAFTLVPSLDCAPAMSCFWKSLIAACMPNRRATCHIAPLSCGDDWGALSCDIVICLPSMPMASHS